MTATYDYFEHDADIGVMGRGPTIEAAFEQAAAAMFAIMAAESVSPAATHETVTATFEESDPELALVTWLNELLTSAQSRALLLTDFRLTRRGDRWTGEGTGVPWPPGAEVGVEVKGATLTMLSVRETDGTWEARCVVDV
jgi:SHS2 domain-containing protein